MSNKRSKVNENHDNDIEEDQESENERNNSDMESDEDQVQNKEIQVDFEGRNPEDCDFHGIKQMLRQLFLKSSVDLGELAQIIISQNYIGSVIKQCLDDNEEEDDDDDDGSDGVFGVTTIINITKRKNETCIQQIRALLRTLAEANAGDEAKQLVGTILDDDSKNVGLIINERIINIPANISVPIFSSLECELYKAISRSMSYKFQFLIWICKTYKTDDNSEVLYANEEEKVITPEALASFDVDVSDQMDFSQWDFEGGAMSPSRKILILEARKFPELVFSIKRAIENK